MDSPIAKIVERYSYDVFGQPTIRGPSIGRFLQTDPIRYEGGLNLYTYCGNNPLNWMDPWGLWEEADHQSLGRYGRSGRFDYGRLDRDYPPHSRYWRRHFRNRHEVHRDLEDACRRGDSRAFEYHMHELQDTYSHGEGVRGGLSHLWHRHSPDNVSQHPETYEAAGRETEEWEARWDEHNPPEPPESPNPQYHADDDKDGKKGS